MLGFLPPLSNTEPGFDHVSHVIKDAPPISQTNKIAFRCYFPGIGRREALEYCSAGCSSQTDRNFAASDDLYIDITPTFSFLEYYYYKTPSLQCKSRCTEESQIIRRQPLLTQSIYQYSVSDIRLWCASPL